MGAIPKKSSNRHYYKLFQGTIVQEFTNKPEDKEGVEVKERVVEKTGKTKYYIETGGLQGRLLSCKLESTDFGDFLNLEIGDKDGNYELSIPVESRYFRDFMMRAPNIDVNNDMIINTYSFTNKEGKKVQGVRILQDDKPVDRFFTKENPNGLPPMVQKRKGKDLVWDSTEQVNFLYDQVSIFSKRLDLFDTAPADKEESTADVFDKEDLKDLPF